MFRRFNETYLLRQDHILDQEPLSLIIIAIKNITGATLHGPRYALPEMSGLETDDSNEHEHDD